MTVKSSKDQRYITKFQQSYSDKHTDEIWIYSMSDDDEFSITGENSSDIQIRLLGGYGKDRYFSMDASNKKIFAYDLAEETSESAGIRLTETSNKEIVSLNRGDFMHDFSWIRPSIGFNSDDGIFLGAKKSWNMFGFKSNSIHSISGSFAIQRRSATFDYEGRFQNELSNYDKTIQLSYLGPRYELNYFGFGNGIPIEQERPDEYYFVRQSRIKLDLGLEKNIMDISQLTYKLSFSKYNIQSIEGRFIDEESDLPAEILNRQFYTGLNLSYRINNYDSSLKPENGFGFEFSLNGQKHLNGNMDYIITSVMATMSNTIGKKRRFVISSHLGFEGLWGDSFFYQAPRIGGANSLRGLRRDRYYGNLAFYNSNDLYIYIGRRGADRKSRNTWGLSFSFDHGRVWSDTDTTDEWHINYGTGIFFSPLDAAVISGSIFFSKNERRLRIGAGWPL